MPAHPPTLLLSLFLSCWLTASIAAEGDQPPLAPDLGIGLGLGDGELGLFDDLPIVVSGSRREGVVTQSPVPISTADGADMAQGGYTTLADVVQFLPGVDMAYTDRNHPMVGVRGLHEVFSDRTLTLIDGVIADNPLYGGSDFPRQPINLLDISHIEVVRGPGGAAWGANALNGVINVLTLSPEDSLGTTSFLQVNQFGDLNAEARGGSFAGPVSWRLSAGYASHVSSADATGDDDASDDDWQASARVAGNLDFRWTDTTRVSAGLGYTHLEEGEQVLLSLPSNADAEREAVRGHLGLTQQVTDHASIAIKTFTNYYHNDDPALMHSRSIEQGGVVQIDLDQIGQHNVSFGADARWSYLQTLEDDNNERFVLVENPTDEYRFGAFIIDGWQISEPIRIEAQVRGDTYNATGTDWAGRLAGLINLDEDAEQVLRVAVARAFRTPLSSIHGVSLDTAFIAPNTPLVTYRPADLDNEHTISFELGWTGRLWDGGLVRADTYYQMYTDLIGYEVTETPTGFPGLNFTDIQPMVSGDATAYGGELEVAHHNRHGRWSLWYAWNAFETDPKDVSIRAFTPAEHKVGCMTRWVLTSEWSGILNYRFASEQDAPGTTRTIAASHRLDLAIAWHWPNRPIDVTVGVHDLLDDTPDGVSIFTTESNPLPGRTLFVRGTAEF